MSSSGFLYFGASRFSHGWASTSRALRLNLFEDWEKGRPVLSPGEFGRSRTEEERSR